MILEEHGRFWWHDEPLPEGCYAPEKSVTGTVNIDEAGRATVDLHGALIGMRPTVAVIGTN